MLLIISHYSYLRMVTSIHTIPFMCTPNDPVSNVATMYKGAGFACTFKYHGITHTLVCSKRINESFRLPFVVWFF